MDKKKDDYIKKTIDGIEIKIFHDSFLPKKTIGLSTDLYNKLTQDKKLND